MTDEQYFCQSLEPLLMVPIVAVGQAVESRSVISVMGLSYRMDWKARGAPARLIRVDQLRNCQKNCHKPHGHGGNQTVT